MEKKGNLTTRQKRMNKLATETMKKKLAEVEVSSVEVPEGEVLEDWLACHVINFFNETNQFYASLVEEGLCTQQTCPVMCAGDQATYYWMGYRGKKKKVSALEYMDLLMSWIEDTLDNPEIFPPDENTPFPDDFSSILSDIFRRLLRVYAHIFCSHFEKVMELDIIGDIVDSFSHFFTFITRFELVPESEFGPVKHLIDQVIQKEKKNRKQRRKLEKQKKEGSTTSESKTETDETSGDEDAERVENWVPDEEALKCQSCSVPFTAFKRRHHCRYCGNIFCNECSENKLSLPKEKLGHTDPVRVCDTCYEKNKSKS